MRIFLLLLFSFSVALSGCKSRLKEDDTDLSQLDNVTEIENAKSEVVRKWDSMTTDQSEIYVEEIPDSLSGQRISVQVDEAILQRYEGVYELLIDPSNEFTVEVNDGILYFTGPQGKTVPFYSESDTSFFDHPLSKETLRFKKRGEYYNMILVNYKGHVLEARHLPED